MKKPTSGSRLEKIINVARTTASVGIIWCGVLFTTAVAKGLYNVAIDKHQERIHEKRLARIEQGDVNPSVIMSEVRDKVINTEKDYSSKRYHFGVCAEFVYDPYFEFKDKDGKERTGKLTIDLPLQKIVLVDVGTDGMLDYVEEYSVIPRLPWDLKPGNVTRRYQDMYQKITQLLAQKNGSGGLALEGYLMGPQLYTHRIHHLETTPLPQLRRELLERFNSDGWKAEYVREHMEEYDRVMGKAPKFPGDTSRDRFKKELLFQR